MRRAGPMNGPARPTDSSRTLALVLRTRYSGYAVIDRWGLCAFGTWNLRRLRSAIDKQRVLESRIAALVRVHAPATAVATMDAGMTDCESVVTPLSRHGLSPTWPDLAVMRRVLLGRSAGESRRSLPRLLATGFFPELSHHVHRDPERERYWRPAWQALGLAVVSLVDRRPYCAAAMAQPEAFAGNQLAATLRDAALRQPV